MKPSLIAKVRIAAALLGAWLFFHGCDAALHPGFVVVLPKPADQEPPRTGSHGVVHLRTAVGSRVFGIIGLLMGGGIVFAVVWSMRPSLPPRR